VSGCRNVRAVSPAFPEDHGLIDEEDSVAEVRALRLLGLVDEEVEGYLHRRLIRLSPDGNAYPPPEVHPIAMGRLHITNTSHTRFMDHLLKKSAGGSAREFGPTRLDAYNRKKVPAMCRPMLPPRQTME